MGVIIEQGVGAPGGEVTAVDGNLEVVFLQEGGDGARGEGLLGGFVAGGDRNSSPGVVRSMRMAWRMTRRGLKRTLRK